MEMHMEMEMMMMMMMTQQQEQTLETYYVLGVAALSSKTRYKVDTSRCRISE